MRVPLSILDLAPVADGMSPGNAARNTLDLARRADALGYHRYWLAEHHNTPGMACPSPALMIGHVAQVTTRIRVGAGGIMLPNHSPLQVAENFRLLEALHPGRIDLGLGRAPGTDQITAHALRRGQNTQEFPHQLAELFAFTGDGFPDDHPYRHVQAEPSEVPLPPVWILGSSDYGAAVAAAYGLGFAFARHLNPRGAVEIMQSYRDAFRPSATLPEPKSILAVGAVAADDTEHATSLAMSMGLGVVRMRQGRPGKLPSPETAAAHDWTDAESDQLRRYLRAHVLGSGAEVVDQLTALAEETAADEVMVMTSLFDHAARCRSYDLIAAAAGLSGTGESTTPAGAPHA